MTQDTTERLGLNLWRITLPNNKSYSYTLMRRRTTNQGNILAPTSRVVIVETKKFMRLVELNSSDFVVPSVDKWPKDKLKGIAKFLEPLPSRNPEHADSVEMPWCGHHFRIEHESNPWWKLWSSKNMQKIHYASFGNGRHRSRFLDFSGAVTMPIEVDSASVEWYMQTCGIRIER